MVARRLFSALFRLGSSPLTAAVVATALGLFAALPCAAQTLVTPLPVPTNCQYSFASEANASGQIVGTAEDTYGTNRACTWKNGALTVIDDRTGSFTGSAWSGATGINADGTVIGYVGYFSGEGSSYRLGFVWKDGVATIIQPFDGDDETSVVDINDVGQVVGYSMSNAYSRGQHGFIWQNGVTTPLTWTRVYHDWSTDQDLVGEFWIQPGEQNASINEAGQVAGFVDDFPAYRLNYQPAVIWDDGTVTDLNPGVNGDRVMINELGQVVASTYDHPWLYTPGAGARDLDVSGLYPLHASNPYPYLLSQGAALNDLGQVLILGMDSNYGFQPFLWTDDGTTVGSITTLPMGDSENVVYYSSGYRGWLNNSGQVAGFLDTADWGTIGYFWDPAAPGVVKTLDRLPGTGIARPFGISEAGLPFGICTNPYAWAARACVWNPYAPLTLVSPGNQSINELAAFSYQLYAFEPSQGKTLAYSVVDGPAGLAVDVASGLLTWTPTEEQGPGDYDITVMVADDAASASATFSVHVDEANEPPTLQNPGPQTVNEGETLSLQLLASDTDLPKQTLTYEYWGGSGNMSVDRQTGLVTWTPPEYYGPGTYTAYVAVSDGNSVAWVFFDVQVNEVNRPPVLSLPSNTLSGEAGSPVAFAASASDPDIPENTLTFSLSGAPSGASIDPATGAFTWTPSAAGDVTFSVVVSDGDLSDTKLISISVTDERTATSLAVASVTGVRGKSTKLYATLWWGTFGEPSGRLPSKTLTVYVDDMLVGDATVGATGAVAMSYNVPSDMKVGPHTIKVEFAGDAEYEGCQKTAPLTVQKPLTALAVASVSGAQGRTTSLYATLWAGSSRLPGKDLTFYVDGALVGTATTNSSGAASVLYSVPSGMAAGLHIVRVTFAEDAEYASCEKTATLTLPKMPSALAVSSVTANHGATTKLYATLWCGSSRLAGKLLHFSVDDVEVGSGTTSATGAVAVIYAVPSGMAPGVHTIKVEFYGDDDYEWGGKKATLTVN